MAAVQYSISDVGTSYVCMWVVGNKENESASVQLGVGKRADGTTYTVAPAPDYASDSEKEIATVHWTRQNGGSMWGIGTAAPSVSSRFDANDCNSINKSGFYTISGAENCSPLGNATILEHVERYWTTGTSAAQVSYGSNGRVAVRTRVASAWDDWYELARRNTFDTLTSGEHTVALSDVTLGTAPTATRWTRILFADKTKTKPIGSIGHRYATDGNVSVRMTCNNPDGSSDSATIWVGYDAAGNVKTYAPTPVSSSNASWGRRQARTPAAVWGSVREPQDPRVVRSPRRTSTIPP